jgi:WD40 repeat protein
VSHHEVGQHGVTALCLGGLGSLQAVDKADPSFTLITGDSNGVVKQWELLTRTIPTASSDGTSGRTIKMEYWPRMSNQRLRKRAHVLKSSHAGPVSALVSSSSKVVSAGKDGSVIISNPTSGDELYRMDGFTKDISSLCLDHDILVTDGMEEYIAIHDFDVTDEDGTTGFEI